ncbi:excisionase family DNA-binding protein [Niallia sp. 01092]|uniref:excisionase family DNA-binding protein n=1 Tax=unclassified Niallia TaxID=2837522 RepID=UPI003FD278FE
MYLTIEETSELLSISATQVKKLIMEKRIKAVHDGEQYLVNKEQFNTHFEQVEKYRKYVEEVLNEPIPEDLDIKDED